MKHIFPIILMFICCHSTLIIGQKKDVFLRKKKYTSKDSLEICSQYNKTIKLVETGKFIEASNSLEHILANSKKINFEYGIIIAKYGKAMTHLAKQDREKASVILYSLLHELKSINIKKNSKQRFKAGIYTTLGGIYRNKFDFEKALEYQTKSIEISKEIFDTINHSLALGSIANIYQKIGDLDESIEYHLKSIELLDANKFPQKLGIAYHNLSQVYEVKKDYETEIKILNLSLKHSEKAKNVVGIAISNISLGDAYILLSLDAPFKEKKELLAKAYLYELNAIKILDSIDHQYYIAYAYNNIGTILRHQHEYSKSELYYKKALKINKNSFNESKKSTAEGLYKTYKESKQLEEALKWLETLIILKDSINNNNNFKEIGQKQAKLSFIKTQEIQKLKHLNEIDQINYKNEKKHLLLKIKQRKQRYFIWTTITAIILISSFLIIILKKWKLTIRQKLTIEKQNTEVKKQKYKIETQHKKLISNYNEINDSLKYAKRLQIATLPNNEDIKTSLKDSFIIYLPKNVVSGDFYWLKKKKDLLYFAVADCTGHGVPGAMVSMVCSTALNRSLKEFNNIEPKDILIKTRELVIATFMQSESSIKDGMDIALCSYSKKKNLLTFSGANNSLFIVRKTIYLTQLQKTHKFNILGPEFSLLEFKGNKQPIGLYENMKDFDQLKIPLFKEDKIYLSTDGFPDQFGGIKGKKFKSAPFKRLLLNTSTLDMESQKEKINYIFNNWKKGIEQVDDICIFSIKL